MRGAAGWGLWLVAAGLLAAFLVASEQRGAARAAACRQAQAAYQRAEADLAEVRRADLAEVRRDPEASYRLEAADLGRRLSIATAADFHEPWLDARQAKADEAYHAALAERAARCYRLHAFGDQVHRAWLNLTTSSDPAGHD
jgi:hypothetical protein